jgi:hypothetical protein
MDVSEISGAFASSGVLGASAASGTNPIRQDPDGDGDAAQPIRHHGHRHRLMEAVGQSLAALGLDPSGGTAASASAAATDGDGDDDGSASANAAGSPPALSAFLHDLFSAIKSDPGQSSAAAGVAGGSAGTPWTPADLASGLQNVVDALGAGGGASNGSLAQLQTDFQNLTGAAPGDASGATLESFLQNLAQRLQGATADEASVGSAVDAAA